MRGEEGNSYSHFVVGGTTRLFQYYTLIVNDGLNSNSVDCWIGY